MQSSKGEAEKKDWSIVRCPMILESGRGTNFDEGFFSSPIAGRGRLCRGSVSWEGL